MYNAAQQCLSYVKKTEKVAYGQFLDRIEFDQWHVLDSLRSEIKNINALNLACLLATMPRMDFTGYRLTQNTIAKKMQDFYNLDNLPTRQAVSKWETELKNAGLLLIPKRVDFRNYQTKTRVFTDKFIKIARRGLDTNVSDKHIHATDRCSTERAIPDHQKPLAPSLSQTENRAPVVTNKEKPQDHASALLEAKQGRKNTALRPPKSKGSKQITRLSKFERSIHWWITGFSGLKTQAESITLFAVFLENQDDEFICQLSRGWLGSGGCKFTDTERSFHIRNLVQWLRGQQIERKKIFSSGAAVLYRDPLGTAGVCQEKSKHFKTLESPEMQKFHKALIFGGEYSGPGKKIIEKFHKSSDQEQEQILKDIHSGVLKLV